jgi:hypothetical protein
MPLPLLPATTFWIVPSHWSTFFVPMRPLRVSLTEWPCSSQLTG